MVPKGPCAESVAWGPEELLGGGGPCRRWGLCKDAEQMEAWPSLSLFPPALPTLPQAPKQQSQHQELNSEKSPVK